MGIAFPGATEKVRIVRVNKLRHFVNWSSFDSRNCFILFLFLNIFTNILSRYASKGKRLKKLKGKHIRSVGITVNNHQHFQLCFPALILPGDRPFTCNKAGTAKDYSLIWFYRFFDLTIRSINLKST